ncbi:aminotransferase class I/II-fold pyridoxal phosphate-dependent enzyme [Rossellomorea vietnamensis]|uniref:Aminotransferase class I/II-fold pyridoxal phosphate-dependent enzyme n=1 Tax=Rossellomorea vietnamensis TaxID=218284 RepID=A0A5D4NIS2_9BACI|nr:aminotransferase class I/II-fold pyridoxal phosphate-dependent enzyme [Rossellomorea vietnamensis]TYS13634.1 aminotransferase class I/II-fold pyridoxal phosphate-dependent enzyme [Rossellomorea vietnamensis]
MRDQNRMPLVEALQRHIQKGSVSFHVPGHKNGSLVEGQVSKAWEYDVTELAGLDDLHAPEDAIREAQELLTEHYQSEKSYFLVNGSTVGNLAMILGVCNEGDVVFVQRNCHKSILNGLQLANVKPVFLHPEFDEQTAVSSGISQATLIQALKLYPNAKALILTYPTYYGTVYDIKSLIELAHGHEINVLVDEAHGAHFSCGAPFPSSSLGWGADVVVQSAHKTLPAMTMGSFLHIGTDGIEHKRIEHYLGMLQSSSPSYPIMGSLDYARQYIASYSVEDIDFFRDKRNNFIKGLRGAGYEIIESADPLKLLVRLQGFSGYELQEELENRSVFAELADPYQVLFILPLIKKGMTFPFEKALLSMKAIEPSEGIPELILLEKQQKITALRHSFKEMEKKEKGWAAVDEAVGKTAAEVLIPYPPGIPLFYPGEEILEESISELKRLMKLGAKFQGGQKLDEGKISIFF